MVAMLADEWREVRGAGRILLLARAAVDLLRTAAVERIAEGRRGPRRGRPAPFSWLDFKLGLRMLVRYPGLTLVGGLAMAFAIATGAAFFEFVSQLVYPELPLDEGDRIVALRTWDAAASHAQPPSYRDFVAWRDRLETVEDLGAWSPLERNLGIGETTWEPVRLAAITASAFRLTRVPPLLGRPLVAADEEPGAPPVVVLGHEVWRARFAGDPGVIGQTVAIGDESATVVGVMPEGFAFPLYQRAWIPLRPDAADSTPGEGPEVRVFGRLAPGVSRGEAQAELDVVAVGAAADASGARPTLRAQVLPYAKSYLDISGWMGLAVMSSNLLLVTFLVLVCANIALLMFARAATREGEIVVRNALGASRGRIVAQLFTEALVLGTVAAVVGLVAADLLLGWGMDALMTIEAFPFWIRDRLAPTTVLYAGGLAVLGSVVAGVLPALKVTGADVAARLRQATAGGGGMRLGGVWTVVIIAQVAVTVAVPAHAFYVHRQVTEATSLELALPAEQYLTARIEGGGEGASGTSAATPAGRSAPSGAPWQEVERRLAADARVLGVTWADRLPYASHPRLRLELEGMDGAPADASLRRLVATTSVAPDFFEVMGARVRQGRDFYSGDPGSEARPVVVNASFVEHVLGGRNAVGRRVRLLGPGGAGAPAGAGARQWHEIVGVVDDLGTAEWADPSRGAVLYRPLDPGALRSVHVAVHVRGAPEALAARLRSIARNVDSGLRLHEVLPLDEVAGDVRWLRFLLRTTLAVCAIAFTLSLAGIYSVTSFSVARRTREIGIRVALGADARRIVAAIFRRSLLHVGVGVLAGTGLTALYALGATAELTGSGLDVSVGGAARVAVWAVLMTGVCLLACVVPVWRALHVEPAEALGAEE